MKENISEKEQFFSKISHDLRGSFTSILGFGDILNDPNENLSRDEISEFNKRISLQSRDTFELLVNFINWLKLENYGYGITKDKIELLDVLIEIQNLHKKEITKKNIIVGYDIPETDYVLMDYEILHSIFNNIFLFLLKTCSENSKISVKSIKCSDGSKCLGISANYSNKDSSFLENIDLRNLNNELSFPIVFAIKFTELSGGVFNFSIDQENNLIINLQLPKK